MSDRDWFVPLAGCADPPLYCFPHAGAGCAQLAGFAKSAARAGLSVWAANLPGRQARLSEPPVTDFDQLVDLLTDALVRRIDRQPYGVFGYCGGALVGYAVLRNVIARGGPAPQRFVVASYEAPDIARRPRRVARLAGDALWSYLLESGGVPATLAGDERLRQVAEPAIRADFAVLGGYEHRPGPALPLPITVCYGLQDTGTPRGALLGWRRHSTQPIDLRGVPGGHWLVDDAGDELARLTAAAMPDTVHSGAT
jgi:medium-chain acyl-[acyl-carrier-protein] hydrolase